MFNFFILCSFLVVISQMVILIVHGQCESPSENEIFAEEQEYLKGSKDINDEALSCGQLIKSRGFDYEEHFVTTDDGYILKMYRIVNVYARAARGSRLKPILMVHGNFLSCSSWLWGTPDGHITEWINGIPPNVSTGNLGFALANIEYDVWLGNNRGTAYSTNHTNLDPSKDEFWDFSYPDMGKYDDPAMVDYVRNITNYDKIVYLGFSQGTMQIFTLLSDDPSFADKLDLNFAISPIAFYNNPNGILGLIPHIKLLVPTGDFLKGPFPLALPFFNAALTKFCSQALFSPICIAIYEQLFGPDSEMLNKTRFPVLTSQIDRTSLKNGFHLIQSWDKEGLTEYDYGIIENVIRYGSIKPPAFPLKNIPTHNLVLISGLNDYIATPSNVQMFRDVLKGEPLVDYVIEYPYWAHLDVVFGIEAYKYCHSVVIDILRTYIKDC